MNTPPDINQIEMTDTEIEKCEKIAKLLGYEQTAYTSTSVLWGLFCLPENPATWRGAAQALRGGCLIKTKQFGIMFVQDLEDMHLYNI